MDDMRKCIGSAKFGIEAHEAPVGDFPIQPSQKDGLGRMCKPHWTAYTRALRKASQAPTTIDGKLKVLQADGEQPVAAVTVTPVREARRQRPEPIRTKPARTPKHKGALVPEAGAQGDAG
jgi:hypothetical protein